MKSTIVFIKPTVVTALYLFLAMLCVNLGGAMPNIVMALLLWMCAFLLCLLAILQVEYKIGEINIENLKDNIDLRQNLIDHLKEDRIQG